MTVLQLITGRGPTGAAAAALADACALQAAGIRTVVASADEPGISDACKEMNLEWRGGLKLGRGASRLLHVPRDIKKLRALVAELGVTAVHTHRTDDQLLAAAALRGQKSVKQIRTWHRAPQAGTLMKGAVRLADGYVCVSREHATTLESSGAKKTAYIPVAVDIDLFKPVEKQNTAAPIRIAHVGRWKRDADGQDRGQLQALAIFDSLKGVEGWTGAIVGRGEMESALRAEAFDKRKLDPARVTIEKVPQTSATEFARVLASYDIGLVFKIGSDGTSRAAAEFLACGVPILVADVAGLREFTEDTDAALAVSASSVESWTRALLALLGGHREELLKRQRAARALAESRHALAVRGAQLSQFYKQL